MSIKTDLKRSLYHVLKQDNFGAHVTRHDRRQILMSTAGELVALGYKITSIQQLQRKHILALSKHWQQKNLDNGTIKNRIAALRHLSVLINKPDMIPKNADLGVGARHHYIIKNRAIVDPDLSGVKDQGIRISLELQRLFGLRREESLKIKPIMADQVDKLVLQGSWCKGNRSREIPIRTAEQRQWLEAAKQWVDRMDQSLIPAGQSYIRHRYCYDKTLQKIGVRSHGLRHAYAQRRYRELTGWECPLAGGPQRNELSDPQRSQDVLARLILSEELGHSRIGVTRNYIA
jgi:site-specific recombinase XerC